MREMVRRGMAGPDRDSKDDDDERGCRKMKIATAPSVNSQARFAILALGQLLARYSSGAFLVISTSTRLLGYMSKRGSLADAPTTTRGRGIVAMANPLRYFTALFWAFLLVVVALVSLPKVNGTSYLHRWCHWRQHGLVEGPNLRGGKKDG